MWRLRRIGGWQQTEGIGGWQSQCSNWLRPDSAGYFEAHPWSTCIRFARPLGKRSLAHQFHLAVSSRWLLRRRQQSMPRLPLSVVWLCSPGEVRRAAAAARHRGKMPMVGPTCPPTSPASGSRWPRAASRARVWLTSESREQAHREWGRDTGGAASLTSRACFPLPMPGQHQDRTLFDLAERESRHARPSWAPCSPRGRSATMER